MRSLPLCRTIGLVLLAVVADAAGRSASAQSRELRQGDLARVSATSPQLTKFVGRVVTLSTDTLVMETDQPRARLGIPRSALTSTEVRDRNASRTLHALAGAGLGLVGGAVVGGTAGALGSKDCVRGYDGTLCGRGVGAILGGMAGGVLGLVVGTSIGLIMPVEHWSHVDPLRSGEGRLRRAPGAEVGIVLHF